TPTLPAEGKWSVALATLADGTYTVQAEQTELLLETGKSAPVTFSVDTVPPAVTLNSVSSPTSDPTPMLGGTGGTEEGDDPAVSVTIYKGSSVGGEVAASGSASLTGAAWTYTSPHLVDGTYTAQAIQKDAAGNTGKSNPRTFVVDTTPPAVTLEPITTPTSNVTPLLEGTAGIKEGDQATVSV